MRIPSRASAELGLVDWGSTNPVFDALPENVRKDSRLVYVGVTPRSREWVLSRAYNLGISLASRTTVLKVDCDTALEPDFISHHPHRPGTVYVGDWLALKTRRDEHLHANGLLSRSEMIWFLLERTMNVLRPMDGVARIFPPDSVVHLS